MLTIELPAEAILAELATSARQSKEEFAQKALLRQMEDYEDTRAADKALEEFYASGEKAIPLAQGIKDLGLEN